MSIRMHKGYWTIFSGDKPIVSCVSFEYAWRVVWEIYQEAKRAESEAGGLL